MTIRPREMKPAIPAPSRAAVLCPPGQRSAARGILRGGAEPLRSRAGEPCAAFFFTCPCARSTRPMRAGGSASRTSALPRRSPALLRGKGRLPTTRSTRLPGYLLSPSSHRCAAKAYHQDRDARGRDLVGAAAPSCRAPDRRADTRFFLVKIPRLRRRPPAPHLPHLPRRPRHPARAAARRCEPRIGLSPRREGH